MTILPSTSLDITADIIPKTSPFPKRKANPWFDEDFQAAKKARNKANRLSNKNPSAANSTWARLIETITKKLFEQKKRDSWKNYAVSVNVNTPSNKVWDMIRKTIGKCSDTHASLKRWKWNFNQWQGGNSKHFWCSYCKKFVLQQLLQRVPIYQGTKGKATDQFKTNRNLRYNKKCTMRDLERSFKKSNNSYPGPDQIHYEILGHLPIETIYILLDIINEKWESDTFPESWREALIISIPKPGKDNFNPLNYRPIALTSCICKTVERMANERIVWYLDNNGLLAKQQCGYRSKRSTIDHLVCIETLPVMHLFKIII